MRIGWKFSDVKKGDKVTLLINPLKNGDPGGMLETATLADGRMMSDGNPPGGVVRALRRARSGGIMSANDSSLLFELQSPWPCRARACAAAGKTPDITGTWGSYPGFRGGPPDPKLVPPPPTPLLLKPKYKGPYEEMRAQAGRVRQARRAALECEHRVPAERHAADDVRHLSHRVHPERPAGHRSSPRR